MRIGILGTGAMGRMHADVYQRMDCVEIAGIVGRNVAHVRNVAAQAAKSL